MKSAAFSTTARFDNLRRNQVSVALLLIAFIGTLLRVYKLESQSLWMDEVASIANARVFDSGGLLALAQVDRVAPLHNLVVWAVVQWFGDSALAVRLPSVIAGVLTIPAIYVIGHRVLGSRAVGLVAAALVAISPFAVWYSQEARMYALLLLLACLYVICAWPISQRALRPAEWLVLTAISVAGFYTHHYMLLLAAAFGLFLLFQGGWRTSRMWIWAGTQVFALAFLAYWMMLTSEQLGSQTAFSKPAVLLWTPYTFYSFIYGLSFGPSVAELRLEGPRAAMMNHLLPVLVSAMAVASLMLFAVRRKAGEHATDGMASLQWLWIWLIVPITLAILATFVTKVQYNVRYAIISYPAMILLLSVAILRIADVDLRSLWRAGIASCTAVVVIASASSLFNWYFDPAYAKEDVRSLAKLLRSDSSSKRIVLNNSRIASVLAYYGAPVPDGTAQVDNLLWGRTPEAAIRQIQAAKSDAKQETWLIEYRSWESDPLRIIAQSLDATNELVQQMDWPGVTLRKYRDRRAGI